MYRLKAYRKQMIIVALIFMFILLPVIIYIHSLIYNATLEVVCAPSDASVMVDGKSVNGKIKVKPGEYTIIVSKDGFESKEEKTTVSQNEEKKIYIALETYGNYYATHSDEEEILQYVIDQKVESENNTLYSNNPIMQKLPYSTQNYSINYGDCNGSFCIVIEADKGAYSVAIKRLRAMDNDIGKYIYQFRNYTNPFSIKNSRISDPTEDNIREVIAVNSGEYNIKSIDSKDEFVMVAITHVDGSFSETYRMVLKNTDNEYIIINKPSLVLSYSEYPSVPEEIIFDINAKI